MRMCSSCGINEAYGNSTVCHACYTSELHDKGCLWRPAMTTDMQIVKLDPAMKARVVAALRSGQYPQGYGALRTAKGYCCYGVMCEVTGNTGQFDRVSGRYLFGTGPRSDHLPRNVSAHLGINPVDYRDGRIYIPVYETDPERLRKAALGCYEVALDLLNDAAERGCWDKAFIGISFSFAEIADLIEERP